MFNFIIQKIRKTNMKLVLNEEKYKRNVLKLFLCKNNKVPKYYCLFNNIFNLRIAYVCFT